MYLFQFIASLLFLFLVQTFGFSAGPQSRSRTSLLVLHQQQSGVVKENDEPLSGLFQRAVVWQRAGDYQNAMQEYKLILKTAQQVDLPLEQYAEVHVNLGALYLRLQDHAEQAKHHFTTALRHRPMAVAHVNLAVLLLQELKHVQDRQRGQEMLQEAKEHCQTALTLKNENDGQQAQAMATRLLVDIEKMLAQLL